MIYIVCALVAVSIPLVLESFSWRSSHRATSAQVLLKINSAAGNRAAGSASRTLVAQTECEWPISLGLPSCKISEETGNFTPLFSHSNTTRSCHEVKCIAFTDASGNSWVRNLSTPGDTMVRLSKPGRPEFNRFVEQQPHGPKRSQST